MANNSYNNGLVFMAYSNKPEKFVSQAGSNEVTTYASLKIEYEKLLWESRRIALFPGPIEWISSDTFPQVDNREIIDG